MKVSSISDNLLETGFLTKDQGASTFNSMRNFAISLLSGINRMGIAIELAEKGDLDAMHSLRTENIGTK